MQDRVAANELAGWTGAAAERFRGSLDKLPGELGNVAIAFEDASSAIRHFASELTEFQHNASYYASRIKSMEEELHSSQRRHDEAQAELAAARLRESVSTDPISLKTAVDAVKDGLSKLRIALDAVEANRGELEHLRREAQTNREDYEQAVRACCTALQNASESTTHSNGAPHIGVFTLLNGIVAKLLQDARGRENNTPTATSTPATTPKANPALGATHAQATTPTPIAGAAPVAGPGLMVTSSLTAPSGWTAGQIDHFLSGTYMAGLGAAFIAAEQEYHVSALFLVALAIQESGPSPNAIVTVKHNLFDYEAFGPTPAAVYANAASFPSFQAGIAYVAQRISVNYLRPGGMYAYGATLNGMNVKYAKDKGWAGKIAGIADEPQNWVTQLT